MASRNKSVLGWAVQLSGLANITPKVMLYYQGVYGRGYDRYLNGLNGKGFDLIPDPDNQGKLYAPETLGYVAGIRYSFSSEISYFIRHLLVKVDYTAKPGRSRKIPIDMLNILSGTLFII